MSTRTNDAYVILHNIRSAYNVGAIFRTADAAGVSMIYLTGYTPLPVDRFNRPRSDVGKAALGAQEYVPWKHVARLSACIDELHYAGVSVAAVEQAEKAIDYKAYRMAQSTAFVFGNEVRGLSRPARMQCNTCLAISQRGHKESLNVATAAGIVLFRVLDV